MRYLVLDVETPNRKNDSICSIGILFVDDETVTDEWHTLVDPQDEFDDFNISIHGITPDMVKGAPLFEEVWARLEPYCRTHVFVAHNARFDLTVLAKALENRHSVLPPLPYLCTVDLGRRLHYCFDNGKGDLVLSTFSKTLGVELTQHHDALYDARACAGILLRLREIYDFDPASYVRTFDYAKMQNNA